MKDKWDLIHGNTTKNIVHNRVCVYFGYCVVVYRDLSCKKNGKENQTIKNYVCFYARGEDIRDARKRERINKRIYGDTRKDITYSRYLSYRMVFCGIL
jgi:hypothetical protein